MGTYRQNQLVYESCHTTALALDVLNNQRDAHKILGDLLEEMGDTAGAQFARSDRKNPRKRLDLAIGLLPMLAAARIACDYFVHICQVRQDAFTFIGDQQLMAIERRPLNRLEAQKEDVRLNISANGQLRGAIGRFQSAVEALADSDSLGGLSASSSDENV